MPVIRLTQSTPSVVETFLRNQNDILWRL